MADNDEPARRDVLKSGVATSGAIVGSPLPGGATSRGEDRSCVPEPGLRDQVQLRNRLEGRTEACCQNTRPIGQNTIGDRGPDVQPVWYGDGAHVGMGRLYSQETDDPLWERRSSTRPTRRSGPSYRVRRT